MRNLLCLILIIPTLGYSQKFNEEVEAPKKLTFSLGFIGEMNYVNHNMTVFDRNFITPGSGFVISNRLDFSERWYLDASLNIVKTSKKFRYLDVFEWNSDSTMLTILDSRYNGYRGEVDLIESLDITLNEDYSVFNFQLRQGFLVSRKIGVELGISYKYWLPLKEYGHPNFHYYKQTILHHQSIFAASTGIAYRLGNVTLKTTYNTDFTSFFKSGYENGPYNTYQYSVKMRSVSLAATYAF